MFLRTLRASRTAQTRRLVHHEHHHSFSTVVVEHDKIAVPALRAVFPLLWLRDSCHCETCVHPSTRQKLRRSSDVVRGSSHSEMCKPVSAEAVDGGLRIKWMSGARNEHISFYSASFLAHHASPAALTSFHRDVLPDPWKAAQFASRPTFAYSELLKQPETLLDVYTQLLRDGLVFVSGVPTDMTDDATCELRVLAARLGEIRRTFYGETWNVRNVRDSKNIAYTNLDLGLHMDLLYFKEPPRYQILHALRNRVHGGQSLFVDALHAAHQLLLSSPESFKLLTETPVPFHYINDGHHLHHAHPTIALSHFSSETEDYVKDRGKFQSRITSINYSPPFQAPLSVHTPLAFYKALAAFEGLLDDSSACVTRLLREGDAVIFDNRRVLHGRAAFEDIEIEQEEQVRVRLRDGETSRWLKGCYLEEDPVLDRTRVLSAEFDR